MDLVLPPLEFARPTLSGGFLAIARDYSKTIGFLATNGAGASIAANSIAGQCLECLLKLVLVENGYIKKRLTQRPLGHDLEELWRQASGFVPLANPVPGWVALLHSGHGKDPYIFRYLEGVHGLSLLTPARLNVELGTVRLVVAQALGKSI